MNLSAFADSRTNTKNTTKFKRLLIFFFVFWSTVFVANNIFGQKKIVGQKKYSAKKRVCENLVNFYLSKQVFFKFFLAVIKFVI